MSRLIDVLKIFDLAIYGVAGLCAVMLITFLAWDTWGRPPSGY